MYERGALKEIDPPGIQTSSEPDPRSTAETLQWAPSSWHLRGILVSCALLLIVSVSLFHRAWDFAPADAIDLRLYSVAVHTPNPLHFLVGDWGEAPYETGQFGMYRPLHPISLWVLNKLVGLRWFPNQFINFGLHSLNAMLLLLLIWRIQRDPVLSFLGASLFLVSIHTVSPAVWVTDRASLQVGLAVLLLMHHLLGADQRRERYRTGYVLLLCLFALLSKESGLIVPLIAIVDAFLSNSRIRDRVISAAPWVGVICTYMAARFLMFGSHATSYSKGGYLFGIWHYDRVTDLPSALRWLCLIDNGAKNLFESFLPALNNEGGFRSTSLAEGLCVALGVLGAGALILLVWKGKLSKLQLECLWIVALNALLHNEVFRYRVLYVAQIAVCLLIASSRNLLDEKRKTLAIGAAALMLLASVVRVDNYVQHEYLVRYQELHRYHLDNVMRSYPGKRIDPEIAREVLAKYGDRE